MLTIAADTLPQSALSYLAFRVACLDTLERVCLARQIDDDGTGCYGFLTEVPFLKAVPPHVQLDLLAETWHKHCANVPMEADMVDESVIYAACETAAATIENDPSTLSRYLENGPLNVDLHEEISDVSLLAVELRTLHLGLFGEAEFLVISQFEDLPPETARRMKIEHGIDPIRLRPMFEVLGFWTMSANFLHNLDGLLTPREIVRTANVLGRKQ